MKEGIIEIVITGDLQSSTLNELHSEVTTIISAQNARAVLCDVRAAKGPHEFGDAFFRTRSMSPDITKLPLAIVETSVDLDYQSFFENTAANAGLLLKWFADIDAARAWLRSKIQS